MAFGTRATLTELPTNRFRNASRVTYFTNSNFKKSEPPIHCQNMYCIKV